MQYAIVGDNKIEAFKGGKGICPVCHEVVISKCGTKVIHHWAHDKRYNCDPWWENETEWHRIWKSCFPFDCREVTHIAESGEIHRADIKTNTGIVVELQHSSISDEERISREQFYINMIWIIDGITFKNNFDIYHMLPSPDSEVAKDIVWVEAKRHMNGANAGIFFRLSDNIDNYPNITKKNCNYGIIHSYSEIKNEVEKRYRGHHQYDWVRPHRSWLESTKPVYIDFHDEFLYKLERYDESDLKCIRLVSKKKIIHDLQVETGACNELCVNGYTTQRSEYGHFEGSTRRVDEELQGTG